MYKWKTKGHIGKALANMKDQNTYNRTIACRAMSYVSMEQKKSQRQSKYERYANKTMTGFISTEPRLMDITKHRPNSKSNINKDKL